MTADLRADFRRMFPGATERTYRVFEEAAKAAHAAGKSGAHLTVNLPEHLPPEQVDLFRRGLESLYAAGAKSRA